MSESMLETLRIAGGDFCVRWSMTLLHFVWQGALVGLFAALAEQLPAKRSATTRYALHTIVLLSLPLFVAVTFATLTVPSARQDITALASSSEVMRPGAEIMATAGQGKAIRRPAHKPSNGAGDDRVQPADDRRHRWEVSRVVRAVAPNAVPPDCT